MRDEQLISVGIDIGTSTTQCVFSRLTLSNTASSFSVPRIRITKNGRPVDPSEFFGAAAGLS